MLSDCRITVNTRGTRDFAFSIRRFFRWSFVTSYASRNVLINLSCNLWEVRPTYRQSQRHTYWYDHTLLKGGQNIFMDCRQNFSRCKNNARFNSLVTSVDSNLGLLFKIQRNFVNPSITVVQCIVTRLWIIYDSCSEFCLFVILHFLPHKLRPKGVAWVKQLQTW